MNGKFQTQTDTDKRSSSPLPLRVLVTAEPYGFGPAAAMAQVFDYLRPRVQYLAFAGAGHTCDVHRQLAYDAVHVLPADGYLEAFRQLCADHDAALVSCDFRAAGAAKAAGIALGIYDPIPWYWPQQPDVLNTADLHICQDFFGVRERVRAAGRENAVIVPPISPTPSQAARRGRHVLMNLGGLCNPHHSQETSASYARWAAAIVPAAAGLYPEVHVATSQAIVNHLQHEIPAARTISPREVQLLLGTSELAAMTPGLGNIYEAAALAKRVFWLPPVTDSQGQQLNILRQKGLAPFAADWHDILPGRAPINYRGDELTVARQMADAIHEASRDPAAAERLRALFLQAHRAPTAPNPLTSLIEQFGAGGARAVAESFVQRVLVPLARPVVTRSPLIHRVEGAQQLRGERRRL